MRLNSKQLISLPVVTKSGSVLGKVGSVDVDTDTGRILTIHAKSGNVIKGLLEQDLLIDWSQVVSINAEHVVVLDAFVEAQASVLASARQSAVSATQLSEREVRLASVADDSATSA